MTYDSLSDLLLTIVTQDIIATESYIYYTHQTTMTRHIPTTLSYTHSTNNIQNISLWILSTSIYEVRATSTPYALQQHMCSRLTCVWSNFWLQLTFQNTHLHSTSMLSIDRIHKVLYIKFFEIADQFWQRFQCRYIKRFR